MYGVVAHMKDINIAIMVGKCCCLWPVVGRDSDSADQTALAKPQRLVEDCRADVLVPESQQENVSVIHAERLQCSLQTPRNHCGDTRIRLDDEAELIPT